jgi:hypothetical protein
MPIHTALVRRHKAVLLPMSPAMRVGTNYPLKSIYLRLVCKRCGGPRRLSRRQLGGAVMVSDLDLLRSALHGKQDQLWQLSAAHAGKLHVVEGPDGYDLGKARAELGIQLQASDTLVYLRDLWNDDPPRLHAVHQVAGH